MARTDIILGSIDDADMPRFIAGVAGSFGNGMEEGETEAAYGRRKLRALVIGRILRYERKIAEEAIVVTKVDLT